MLIDSLIVTSNTIRELQASILAYNAAILALVITIPNFSITLQEIQDANNHMYKPI